MLRNYSIFILILLLLEGCNVSQQNAGKETISSKGYQLVKNWPQLPKGFLLDNPTGLGIDTDQNIFVFHRSSREWPLTGPMPETFIAENTILMLERNSGKIIKSWGAGFFIMPHGLTVDRENNIWVTDVVLHQVFKFNRDGEFIMKLGEEKVPGKDAVHFDMPTDVAVAPDGSFYVSDGYGNSRIVKFSQSGLYQFEWGNKGTQPGEFNIPHAIDLDEKGNVYVADRENKRVQMFDANGKFLKEWKEDGFGNMYSVTINKKQNSLIGVDYVTNYLIPKGSDIIFFDSTTHSPARFGRSGAYDGPVTRYHDVAIDNEGNIYVGDILGNAIQKFQKGSN